MELAEAQEFLAYTLGRTIAAEKALQTFIGSPQPNAPIGELLRTNLGMRRQQLPLDLTKAGLPEGLMPSANAGFVAQERAIVRGLQGGKFVPLGWLER